jgi:hypothetical protein
MRPIPFLLVPVAVLCALPAAANAQVLDSAAASRSLKIAASLIDRVALDSTPGDSAVAWLQEARREVAAAAPALDEKRRIMVVLWVESLLRNELARVRVLEAVRRPDSSTIATAAAAVDSAETNFFNCDIACTPRDYRALMHLSAARTRLDSLQRARRNP